jgi:CubicO group peptidase (beta-lactamase class C family)
MRGSRRLLRAALATAAVVMALPLAGDAQSGAPSVKADPPRFIDPDRRQTLSAAFPEIDRIFRAYLADARVPGAAWAVIVDGEVAHSGQHGLRDLESKSAVDQDTVFRIASMTKSFTALAILTLRDEGKLSLDDPAERYVPELARLPYPTADSPRLTIRHLLSHAGGFPEDNPWGDQQLAITDEAMTALMTAGIPFSNPPGIAYEYSNYGFAILGRIVSRVSGIPYADYVARRILAPLGMTSTTLEAAAVPPGRLALGYRWEDETWKLEPALADGAFGAMGGMLTSMRDLSRYVAFLMSAFPPRDEADDGPVRRASLREMQQPWRARPALVTQAGDGAAQLNATAYAFGLRTTQTCAFPALVGHSGGLPGYGSLMLWLPEYGVGLLAAGNLTYTGWGPRFDAAFDALARTGALQPRVPQPSPALVDMRAKVSALVQQWNEGVADEIAAGNLFLDRSKDRRRADFEAIRATHGMCTADDTFDVENALRGQWTMACERGVVRVAITLAPTMPPRVQFVSLRSFERAEDVPQPAVCTP